MAHDRRLVTSGSIVVPGRLRDSSAIRSEVRDELEAMLVETGFFERAPFRWIGLMFRYSDETNLVPEFEPIDPSDGELPMTIELELRSVRRLPREEAKRVHQLAAIDAIISAAQKFGLPDEALWKRKAELTTGMTPGAAG